MLRQAISHIKARKEKYHVKKKNSGTKKSICVSPRFVRKVAEYKEKLLEREKQILGEVKHMKIVYEEDIRSEYNHQNTIDEICEYLGVKPASVSAKYSKATPMSTKSLVANYEELENEMVDTKFEKYLSKK